MTTTTPRKADARPALPAPAGALLASLRRRIRRYVWWRGLAWAVGCLVVAFWASLAWDWFFEPPPVVRVAVPAVAAAAFGWVVLEMIVARLRTPLSDRNMAMLVERRFPVFNESLMTAVELTEADAFGNHGDEETQPSVAALRGGSPIPNSLHVEMLAQTCRAAGERVDGVELSGIFDPRPLRRSVAAAMLLVASLVVFAVCCPQAMGVWARRNVLMADEIWPRNTRLVVEGFHDGRVKIARGGDFTLVAKADLDMPEVPAVVKIRYRAFGGSERRATMDREAAADRTKDRFQRYSHTFRGVLSPIRLDVFGGDAAVSDLWIDVVDSPAIVRMSVECRYPDYIGRPPRMLPVAGPVPIAQGSDVTLRAAANKDLRRVVIDRLGRDTPENVAELDFAGEADCRDFTFPIADFRQDTTLVFTLYDTDGIKSREPLRLVLVAVADQPPGLALKLRGIGSAITPLAMLPVAGTVSDDHGLGRVWCEYTLGDGPPREATIAASGAGATEFELAHVLDCRDLLPQDTQAGTPLLVCVKAADQCDLGAEPNVGTSQQWLLDVVTPDELRTMLESRELVLRQRFEAILSEVTETRSLLAGVQFNDRSGTVRLQIERALANSRKNAGETLSVAVGFEGIREELINNRIDTEELKVRLQDGIAAPLRRIGEVMYPELERRLTELSRMLVDEAAASKDRDAAVAELDGILAAMREVLAKMIELEDFNEAVAMLRRVIEAQQRLNRQTEAAHKNRLRGLLED